MATPDNKSIRSTPIRSTPSSNMRGNPPASRERFLVGRSAPFTPLAEHLTALPARCKQATSVCGWREARQRSPSRHRVGTQRCMALKQRAMLRSGRAGHFVSLDRSAYQVGTRWYSRCCLLRDRRRAASFLSCTTETETTLVPLWETPKIRLPNTINTIPVPGPR